MVVLGPLVFAGFEVPERIALGGQQRLAVHDLPGGGRVIDALGAADADLVWSGVMSGPDAEGRVRLLDGLRRGGLAWPLAWDGWRYTVIIKRFQASVAGPFWAPYRITCAVVAQGDAVVQELLPVSPSGSDVLQLTALSGGGLDAALAAATVALRGVDLGPVAAAAGQVAQLVTARAFATVIRNVS